MVLGDWNEKAGILSRTPPPFQLQPGTRVSAEQLRGADHEVPHPSQAVPSDHGGRGAGIDARPRRGADHASADGPRDAPRRQGHSQNLPRLRDARRAEHAPCQADRCRLRAHRRPRDSVERGRHPRSYRSVQGRRPGAVQPDDLRVQRRHLGQAGRRRADCRRHRVHSRCRQGGPAGHREQLLREPAHGGLQGTDRPRRRRATE